jgi:hypothetical protein
MNKSSPADYNYDETVSTLKYAHRAKSIANVVTRNEDLTERVIRDLQGQIEALKQQLASSAAGGGQGGGAADPELLTKLQMMQSQQQSAWEEREKLSKMLEEERQRNMNAVVGDMMKQVKQQKRDRIKRINGLTNEKTALTKKFKDNKEINGKLTAAINEKTKSYQQLQRDYESTSALLQQAIASGNNKEIKLLEAKGEDLASAMSDLVTQVESDRILWQQQRDDLEALKLKLTEISDEIIDEKAELVTFAGLLDQNDKLRSQIQDEERAKAKQIMDEEMALAREALEREKDHVRDSIESEMLEKMESMQRDLLTARQDLEAETQKSKNLNDELLEQWEFCANLEHQLREATLKQQEAEAEAARAIVAMEQVVSSTIDQRVSELQDELQAAEMRHQDEIEELQRAHAIEREQMQQQHRLHMEDVKYDLFKHLMDSFSEERSGMQEQIRQLQQLLQQAASDVAFLSKRNDELKVVLTQSLQWEPAIAPGDKASSHERQKPKNSHNTPI